MIDCAKTMYVILKHFLSYVKVNFAKLTLSGWLGLSVTWEPMTEVDYWWA